MPELHIGTVKAAAGNDAGDSFERSFANLVQASLKEKAPGLQPYMIGFETLDSSEEGDRGVGVAGFKIGDDQYIFAPCFFVNGEVKGLDLLYMKDQDQFIPLQEAWINWAVNRKPTTLGTSTDTKLNDMGPISPDFRVFRQVPQTQPYIGKEGSFQCERFDDADGDLNVVALTMPENMRGALKMFEKRDPTYMDKRASETLNLENFLGSNPAAMQLFLQTMQKSARFANAYHTAYGDDAMPMLERAFGHTAKTAAVEESKQPDVKKVEVIRGSETVDEEAESFDLSTDEKSRLLQGDVIVRDKREDDEASTAYHLEVAQQLQNASEAGIYEMMVRPFDFTRVAVIQAPMCPGQEPDAEKITVVELEGDKRYCNARPAAVWVKEHGDEEDWETRYSSLSSLDNMSTDNYYCLVNDKLEGTAPFRLVTQSGSGGDRILCIDPESYTHFSEGFAAKPRTWKDRSRNYYGECGVDCCSRDSGCPAGGLVKIDYELPYEERRKLEKKRCHGRHIYLSDKATHMHNVGDTLIVPTSFKVLSLKGKAPSGSKDRTGTRLEPAGLADVERLLTKAGSEAEYGIARKRLLASESGGFILEKEAAKRQLVSQHDILEELVVDQGLREDTARELITQSQEKMGRWTPFWVSYASGYPLTKRADVDYLTKTQPGAPNMASSAQDQPLSMDSVLGVLSQQPDFNLAPVDSMEAPEIDPDQYLSDPDINRAEYASRTGQKEVFDTSSIASLTKAVNIEDLIDKYLADVITGMDRLGRLLFMYYWHYDAFKDRYGNQDMMDLEEALRNTFKETGDVVLFLKQKRVLPEPKSRITDVDLSQLNPASVEA